MSNLTRSLFLAIAGSLLLTIYACRHEGPAEKAGEKIDDGIHKAGDKLKYAAKGD